MVNLKVLISGAGVAGLTCAALLEKQGIKPQIIEREKETNFNKSGYMLGLLPLGGRVLNQLDLKEAYVNTSTRMENYEIFNEKGDKLKSYPLKYINESYGHYGGISREKLIELILNRVKSKIIFDSEIKSLKNKGNKVEVNFEDEKTNIFDLVIIAEGLHSKSRKLLLSENEFNYYETGWGGWVTWLNEKPDTSYREFRGNGSFLGLYPVENKLGAFLGGPVNHIKKIGKDNFINEIKNKLSGDNILVNEALESISKDKHPFIWNFHDCKSSTWYKGSIVLLGDTATGFLPTAGVGASMAMDSASALSDELSRADEDHINYALKLYSKRQKARVEKAQKDSRNLGKFMFLNSKFKAAIRNRVLKFYTLQRMLSDLSGIMEGN